MSPKINRTIKHCLEIFKCVHIAHVHSVIATSDCHDPFEKGSIPIPILKIWLGSFFRSIRKKRIAPDPDPLRTKNWPVRFEFMHMHMLALNDWSELLFRDKGRKNPTLKVGKNNGSHLLHIWLNFLVGQYCSLAQNSYSLQTLDRDRFSDKISDPNPIFQNYYRSDPRSWKNGSDPDSHW